MVESLKFFITDLQTTTVHFSSIGIFKITGNLSEELGNKEYKVFETLVEIRLMLGVR